jgi:uncharacterized membrane-anchored protein
MIISKNKIAYLLALALPFIVLGYITLSNHHKHNSGELWHVEIAGYDPRDLIHGRFLRYRISWNEYGNVSGGKAATDALCLMRSAADPRIPTITQIKADQTRTARCDSLLNAGRAKDHWNIPLRQYYIPEEFANTLDWAFGQTKNKFTVDLRIGGAGTLSVTDLYINGEIMHKAMPALKAAYNSARSGERNKPQTWRFKIKDITPYYISDEQNCVTYDIDWAHYGLEVSPYQNTPDLCLIPSPKDARTPIISIAAPDTNLQGCASIAESTPWNNNSWNRQPKTICQSAQLGKFMIAQSKINAAQFEVENTINNMGNFYSTELFINGQTLKDAMKNDAAHKAP